MSYAARGPVLISYRRSDGYDTAIALAWALRAAGVPVWQDDSDLLAGDTRGRLEEAVNSGLSAAVLLVTPEISSSNVVRDVELPGLLALAKDPHFTLLVASTIETPDGSVDRTAPDRLLGQSPGILAALQQYGASNTTQRARIAAVLCHRRLEQLRPEIAAGDHLLTLDVQTRLSRPPAESFDLVVRLQPPADGQHRPHVSGLHDLGRFLGELPRLVAISGARSVEVQNGAHLSVACALGAALPTTLLGRVVAVDNSGNRWITSGVVPSFDSDRVIAPVEPSVGDNRRGPVLVYVDLLPNQSDAPFDDFVEAQRGRFAGIVHLRTIHPGRLDAADAARIVGEVNQEIRTLADVHRTAEVHLFLRCPYPVALLLGRSLNTLSVHLYEYENDPGPEDSLPPRYLPSLVLRSGSGGSPIRKVTAPPADSIPFP